MREKQRKFGKVHFHLAKIGKVHFHLAKLHFARYFALPCEMAIPLFVLVFPLEIQALWGIDVIGKISPKSSNGHEYILVVVDYFNKWVETASYARLTVAKVATFTREALFCIMGLPYIFLYFYRATLYSLVYGMEVALPVKIEMDP
ncbi:hypothetical protein CK203_060688 [Vitis vinifera]|uniref:Integrase catalytic domain-containing protein n=1 Tax=Vitis vinifera TaxID=29760 RepID=A0A438GA66_VITVI|nr:hypothetical protein CK203_060688 [Vitis vinifera]